MADVKHFNYEGHAHLKTPPEGPKVVGVEFLTPARVTVERDGKRTSVLVDVDIVNRRAYDTQGNAFDADAVFAYLDSVNTLPDEFFQAPESVYDKVEEAEAERVRQQEHFTGAHDG